MGILDFRKPKWQHKNPAVRLESIDSIDPRETEILATLVREDSDQAVRHAAINRIIDLTTIDQLANGATSDDLAIISSRKDHLLYDQIINSSELEASLDYLQQIISQYLLVKLAINGKEPAIRLAAVSRVEDQLLLAGIVKQNCGKDPAKEAMAKINDEELLTDLCKSAASKTARKMAADKLAAIEQQRKQPDQDEITEQALTALVTEAGQLHKHTDIDVAATRLAAIRQEWQKLDKENKSPSYDAFAQVCNDFENRYHKIQERRRLEEAKSARYEQQQVRLNEICCTVERLITSIADDAVAAKTKAVTDWSSLQDDPNDKVVPSATMTKRFADACQSFDLNRKKIDLEKSQIDAVEKKCAETKKLIASKDLRKAAARLAETISSMDSIKFKYFNKATSQKLVTETSEDLIQSQQEIRDQNLSKRREICTELETLAEVEIHNQTERKLQALREAWLQLPNLDDAEGKDLEQRYQKTTADLTEKLKAFEHEQDWQLWANLSLKEKLTEKVVALDQQDDLENVVNVIKRSQIEWKDIGPIPKKESQKLWDKFHAACNRNFERAAPYLEELNGKRADAMVRRKEIITLATEMAESTEWKKTTAAIIELQEEWKNLLPGSRREENKLYKEFRNACNRFFERRQEDFKIREEGRQQNLSDKEKLCEEAEQLAANPQADYSKKFQQLQAEWRKIGPVPRKKDDAVWKRFRAACETYFNWLEEGFQQNLKRKEELCEEVEKLLAETTEGDNQKEIATKLTEMQQQWKEIGPVPRSRKDAIWKRFRKPCDIFFTARQEQFAKEDEKRRANQSQKEDLLAQAEDLASQGTDKKAADKLQKLQKEWFEIGPAPREINKELNDRFKTLCDAFFEGRRQFFTDLKSQHLDNQKKKESLCLRLENIMGTSFKSSAKGKSSALSLAEELKQAMEDNFMLAGRRDKKDLAEEVKKIEDEWQKIGSVPYKHNKALAVRYKKALDAYYKSQRS